MGRAPYWKKRAFKNASGIKKDVRGKGDLFFSKERKIGRKNDFLFSGSTDENFGFNLKKKSDGLREKSCRLEEGVSVAIGLRSGSGGVKKKFRDDGNGKKRDFHGGGRWLVPYSRVERKL